MRTLSSDMLAAGHAQETDKVLLARISINHPLIVGGPLRLVSNLENATASGNVFTAFPFQIVLPDEAEDGAAPRLRLVLDAVDQTILAAIRALPPTPAPTLDVELFLAHQPETVERSWSGLTLRQVSYDTFTISGELLPDEDDREPYPQYTVSPAHFPGVF